MKTACRLFSPKVRFYFEDLCKYAPITFECPQLALDNKVLKTRIVFVMLQEGFINKSSN